MDMSRESRKARAAMSRQAEAKWTCQERAGKLEQCLDRLRKVDMSGESRKARAAMSR